MISEIRIQNFKSIQDLTLKPGRVTVLIGENGSGKSNVIEGITFGSAAALQKLDSEFLINRGIRVTDYEWMRCAFPHDPTVEKEPHRDIEISGYSGEENGTNGNRRLIFECRIKPSLRTDDGSFEGWTTNYFFAKTLVDTLLTTSDFKEEVERLRRSLKLYDDPAQTNPVSPDDLQPEFVANLYLVATQRKRAEEAGFSDFLIYAPENTVLRTPPPEGAIQPLGVKGEGLFKLLRSLTDPDSKFADRLADLKERLHLFGWFEDFISPDEAATAQARLQIRDRWLDPTNALFDQRSANEGFLYVLFYLTLLISWRTPRFFAIDNVDNALNPKLCAALMRQVVELAKKYDKQVICTTHNPSILDGLDLKDDEQRLYTVFRDSEGHTTVNRVRPPQPQAGETPVRLSQAFLSGYIGGLPDNF